MIFSAGLSALAILMLIEIGATNCEHSHNGLRKDYANEAFAPNWLGEAN
jgi:hypothetical protein